VVEEYENRHHDLPHGDPVVLLEYKLKELKLTVGEVSERLGWDLVEIMERKRELKLSEARQLLDVLGLQKGAFC
jgi:antitoxin component HigA of HigAB toxin-antitoxin module